MRYILNIHSLKKFDYVLTNPSKMRPDAIDLKHAEIFQKLNPAFYVTDGPDPRFCNLMDRSKFIILDKLNPEQSTASIINRILKFGN